MELPYNYTQVVEGGTEGGKTLVGVAEGADRGEALDTASSQVVDGVKEGASSIDETAPLVDAAEEADDFTDAVTTNVEDAATSMDGKCWHLIFIITGTFYTHNQWRIQEKP